MNHRLALFSLLLTTAFLQAQVPDRAAYNDFPKALRTGDILSMKNQEGEVSHAILWVGDMGKSPKDEPLILDSTGDVGIDANGDQIRDGIYLRAFRPTGFYFRQASHAIRVIPDEAK